MIQWLDDFYGDPELRSTLLESFLPVFSNYIAEATGGPVAASFVQAIATSYIERHLGSSRAQLQEVIDGADDPLSALTERFTEWEEKRPGKVARNELVRAANAAQVERMREQGVTRKVWRSSGGSCPYCTGLNGRTVAVEEAFFTPDDEYTPEGAESPLTFTSKIGHPPVHQGCDCSIEAFQEIEVVEGPIGEVVDSPGSDVFRALTPQERAELVGNLSAGDQQWVADAIRRGEMTIDDLVRMDKYDRWREITSARGRDAIPDDVRALMGREFAEGSDANRVLADYYGTTEADIRARFGDEATGLNHWTNGPYGMINGHFRNGTQLNPMLQGAADNIDSVMARTSIPTNVVVHRSVDYTKGIFPVADIDQLPTLIGREWRDPGFFATSPGQLTGQFADPTIYDVRMEIMVPQGTRGVITNPFNRHGENELLLDRGTTLSIVDATPETVNGRTVWNIKAVVVAQDG